MAKRNNKNRGRNKSKSPVYIGFALVAIVLIGFIWSGVSSGKAGTAVVSNGKQVVNIKATAAGYSPSEITVKKGIPLEMNFDVSADAGCVGGVVVKDYGINKALTLGAKGTITFTPDKVGTTQFSCQMYMSTGNINVVA